MAVKIVNVTQQLGATSTLLYTCPTNKQGRIIDASVSNDTTTVPTYTIHRVPTGQSVGDAYLLVNAEPLDSKASIPLPTVQGKGLVAGDRIYGIASVANQVTISLSIAEMVAPS